MEVAGLAFAVPSILAGFMKIVKTVNDVQTKYKTVPYSMDAMAAYCGVVHVAMLHLMSHPFRDASVAERFRG